ncbi:hypothetical protein [Gryllotalpicola ginsengisoli]|uniref:hypothetical protein n=1 Tax=Gryllotalpicola ginsengisoli TaxID=444608 RepID=UPI0003B468B5|nr:hypothetical protein [Gryllotalpicola ginsengisoli]
MPTHTSSVAPQYALSAAAIAVAVAGPTLVNPLAGSFEGGIHGGSRMLVELFRVYCLSVVAVLVAHAAVSGRVPDALTVTRFSLVAACVAAGASAALAAAGGLPALMAARALSGVAIALLTIVASSRLATLGLTAHRGLAAKASIVTAATAGPMLAAALCAASADSLGASMAAHSLLVLIVSLGMVLLPPPSFDGIGMLAPPSEAQAMYVGSPGVAIVGSYAAILTWLVARRTATEDPLAIGLCGSAIVLAMTTGQLLGTEFRGRAVTGAAMLAAGILTLPIAVARGSAGPDLGIVVVALVIAMSHGLWLTRGLEHVVDGRRSGLHWTVGSAKYGCAVYGLMACAWIGIQNSPVQGRAGQVLVWTLAVPIVMGFTAVLARRRLVLL